MHSHLIAKTSEHDNYSAYVGKFIFAGNCLSVFPVNHFTQGFLWQNLLSLFVFIAFSFGLEPKLPSRLHTWLLLRLPHQHPITDVISRARVYQFPFSLNACVFAFCGHRWGSNHRPLACKAGDIPTEIRANLDKGHLVILTDKLYSLSDRNTDSNR